MRNKLKKRKKAQMKKRFVVFPLIPLFPHKNEVKNEGAYTIALRAWADLLAKNKLRR